MAGEMLISKLPNRSGLYLGYEENGTWHTIARFTRGEESAKRFLDWARKAGIRCEGDMTEKGRE